MSESGWQPGRMHTPPALLEILRLLAQLCHLSSGLCSAAPGIHPLFAYYELPYLRCT